MKTIGLLGGMAWPSTIEYYRQINKMMNQKLGKSHSAKIVLRSIDYETIKKYNYKDWEKIEIVLEGELYALDQASVDCILLCNNTLHKAYDKIESRLKLKAPFFHIVDCAGEYAKSKKFKHILLIGTKFTMEDDFYRERLERQFGLTVSIPAEKERNEIQRIVQEELAKEVCTEQSKYMLQKIIVGQKCDAVVVACTELPMIVKQEEYTIPILNTVALHCERAVEFALEKV